MSPALNFKSEDARSEKKFFRGEVFLAIEQRMVLYNVFIEGDTPLEGQDLDPKTWVHDSMAGLSFMFSERYRLDYIYVVRSEEFETQADDQKFGSVRLVVTL